MIGIIARPLITGDRVIASGCATQGLKPVDAYRLCSVAGDLRISEIVDQPNWVVSFYFPRQVFG